MESHSPNEFVKKNFVIIPIVEGHSEVISVPPLIRRILGEKMGIWDIKIAVPFRVKRNRVVRDGELERTIKQAERARQTENDAVGGILVLLDTDPDDCPKDLVEPLLLRARTATRRPVSVVLPQMELEAWLLASKEKFRGFRGIREDATSVEHPENIRGAKERLSRNMVAGRRYIEVDDQAALIQQMDIELCRERCRSFRKLIKEIEYLVSEMMKI